MSYIPNCREDEYYNEKNLIDYDKEFVHGYDWAVKNLETFFSNIDGYTMEFDIEGEDINLVRFLENHPKVSDTLEEVAYDWLEKGRDELITSMLDNSDIYPIEGDE